MPMKLLWLALLGSAAAFRLPGELAADVATPSTCTIQPERSCSRPVCRAPGAPAKAPLASTKPMRQVQDAVRTGAGTVLAASLALALGAANPTMTHATAAPPAVVRTAQGQVHTPSAHPCSHAHDGSACSTQPAQMWLARHAPLNCVPGDLLLAPQVERYGAAMIAADDDLREAQRKFLEERAKLATTYEASTDSTYKSEDETRNKKPVYVTIVGGLIVIAFVAPMVQFFYYTGGD